MVLELKAEVAGLNEYYGQARFRLAETANQWLKRVPGLHKMLKDRGHAIKRALEAKAEGSDEAAVARRRARVEERREDGYYLGLVEGMAARQGGRDGGTRAGAEIDVIVPVYKGIGETLCCLGSVLAAKVGRGYEVVVIEDAGPEEILRKCLRRWRRRG